MCWIEPWALESSLISQFDLPLNVEDDHHNAFHGYLKELRVEPRQQAPEPASFS
ncbi:GIY-YIG nuclease family protein [Streptomyces sp. NPDC127077]|uniref:GIY-YIG nuclease family protein n=1 Tax=Streptomyces sp. NPDC127077 TaxID=3347131 RepID=UPI00365A887A